jgi:hypothetical protein
MFLLDGNPLSPDRAFTTADGTQYPANWLRRASPEERAAIGITEAPEPEPYDQRFYWGPGNPKLLEDRPEADEEGNPLWVQAYDPVTEEMVDTEVRLVTKGLKSQWISQVKQTAGSMLSQSDWMIIRKAERGVEIPESPQALRAAVVAEADRLEVAIAACETVEALIEVVAAQDWPKEG